MPVVVVRQRKAWRRRDGVFLYFEVHLETLYVHPISDEFPGILRTMLV